MRAAARVCQRGGSLVATHETSLYDEWGVRRKDFGLADLFGVSFNGKLEGPMQNSYLSSKTNPATSSACWRARRRGPHHQRRAPRGRVDRSKAVLEPAAHAHPVLSGPADGDGLSARRPNTDISEVVSCAKSVKGRVVYFPWDIDRTFWEVLSTDHGKLLRNAVDWASDEEPPVTVTGAGVLDVTVWRQKESMTVHLVNLTNPMMMKGPIREIFPVASQKVKVRLPPGKKARKVQLLVAGGSPPVQEAGGYLTVTVPSIDVHEVVAIDLA